LRVRLLVSALLVVFESGHQGFSAESAPSAATESPWVEKASHRFRLDGIRGCGAATLTGIVSGPDKATDSRDSAPLLGFFVRVEARTPGFFVSPRDLTLEAGGVVLDAMLAHPDGRWRCSPALSFTRLASGREARGFVFFRVPPAFRASPAPIALVYHPTRWGGAPRATIAVSPCLETCAPARNSGSAKQRLPIN
jgi:hypothetical protein